MPQTVLTDHERRVIGQLSIPRNVQNLLHEIRIDPYHQTPHEVQLADDLQTLAGGGYVVNLGSSHDAPGKIASAVDKHKQARSMHDEKARIYEARLLNPARSWRADGDMWIITDQGFEALHEPVPGEPQPLPRQAVEALMQEEAARLYKGDPSKIAGNGKVTLANKLLEEEFTSWVKSIQKYYKELTGETLRPPVMGGAGYSDATEVLILDPENGKGTAYTEVTP